MSFLGNNRKESVSKAETTETTISGSDQASNSLKGGALYVSSGSEYYMYNGKFSGYKRKYGGAVYVASGGKFILDGGVIENNTACYGGAIYVEKGGVCHIKKGSIKNNGAQVSPAIHVEPGATLIVDDMSIIKDNYYVDYLDLSSTGFALTIKNIRNDNSIKVHRAEKVTISNGFTITFFDTELNQQVSYTGYCDGFWYDYGIIYNETANEDWFDTTYTLTEPTTLIYLYSDYSIDIDLDKDGDNVSEQTVTTSYMSEIIVSGNQLTMQTDNNKWTTYTSPFSSTIDAHGRIFTGWSFDGEILADGAYTPYFFTSGNMISATYKTLKSIDVQILDMNNNAVIFEYDGDYIEKLASHVTLVKNSDNDYYTMSFVVSSIDDIPAEFDLYNVEIVQVSYTFVKIMV